MPKRLSVPLVLMLSRRVLRPSPGTPAGVGEGSAGSRRLRARQDRSGVTRTRILGWTLALGIGLWQVALPLAEAQADPARLFAVITSGGGSVLGPSTTAQTMLGLPIGEYPVGITTQPSAAMGLLVNVTGTITESSATLTVNGLPATITGNTFLAPNVPLHLGPNTISAVATTPTTTRSASMRVYLDVPEEMKAPGRAIQVQGIVEPPDAAVSVNETQAAVEEGRFRVSVPLSVGVNILTAIAIDTNRNRATHTIRVFVPRPTPRPPRPTVGTIGDPIPSVTLQSTLTIGGTKAAGSSVWINGEEHVPNNDHTIWTATITLTEGDNILAITARATPGVPSAPILINIVMDSEPPVLMFQPPAITNLSPILLRGSVDDHLTTVTINGIVASRTGRAFELELPLGSGANALRVEAISPNGHRTSQTHEIVLGTLPRLDQIMPVDGTLVYADHPLTLDMSATDQEGDALEYHVSLDGAPLIPWSATSTHSWVPSMDQHGLHTLSFQVRDAYGGARSQDAEIIILHPPILPP